MLSGEIFSHERKATSMKIYTIDDRAAHTEVHRSAATSNSSSRHLTISRLKYFNNIRHSVSIGHVSNILAFNITNYSFSNAIRILKQNGCGIKRKREKEREIYVYIDRQAERKSGKESCVIRESLIRDCVLERFDLTNPSRDFIKSPSFLLAVRLIFLCRFLCGCI